MGRFTNFLLFHDADDEEFLVNIADLSMIRDHCIYLRSIDEGILVKESFQEINNMLVEADCYFRKT